MHTTLTILYNILIFISVVLILVTIHELGHFIVAKLFGIKVLRFSVGFGKPLFKIYDRQGTEYVIAPIPLGGYVKLLDSREEPVAIEDRHREFNSRPLIQRFLVLLAGPGFNFLFAIFAFWVVFTMGINYVRPIIGNVIPNTAAAQAGLKSGDEIIAIDNQLTPHWPAVSMQLVAHYGQNNKLMFRVHHQAENQELTHVIDIDLRNTKLNALRPNLLQSIGIVPYYPSANKSGKIILPADLFRKIQYPFFSAFLPAVQATYDLTTFNFIVLYKMVTGVISWQSLGGPLTILEIAAAAANLGFVVYLNFLALLSISIAIINLLPIPGLDGGQIFYLLIELIHGKPLSIEAQLLAFRLGVIILILLIVTAISNDLLRLM